MLDEPTSGVDPLARARLWETIRETAGRGAGAWATTTHHMDEAQECDRLVVMAGGRVVAEGSVAEIVGSRRVVVVETAEWTRAFEVLDRARVPAALVGRTLRVPDLPMARVAAVLGGIDTRLTEAPATLEERFLQLSTGGGAAGRLGATREPEDGRRAGGGDTRTAIAAAAREEFARSGYDGATIRAMAKSPGWTRPWSTTTSPPRRGSSSRSCPFPPCPARSWRRSWRPVPTAGG